MQLPVRVLLAVVVNEAQLAELIQKETDTGALNPAGIDIEKALFVTMSSTVRSRQPDRPPLLARLPYLRDSIPSGCMSFTDNP